MKNDHYLRHLTLQSTVILDNKLTMAVTADMLWPLYKERLTRLQKEVITTYRSERCITPLSTLIKKQ